MLRLYGHEITKTRQSVNQWYTVQWERQRAFSRTHPQPGLYRCRGCSTQCRTPSYSKVQVPRLRTTGSGRHSSCQLSTGLRTAPQGAAQSKDCLCLCRRQRRQHVWRWCLRLLGRRIRRSAEGRRSAAGGISTAADSVHLQPRRRNGVSDSLLLGGRLGHLQASSTCNHLQTHSSNWSPKDFNNPEYLSGMDVTL